MATVVVLEPEGYSRKALDIYAQLGPVHEWRGDRAVLAQELRDAEVLVVRLAHKLTADFLAQAPVLKIIATPTTGLDHIDQAAAADRNIKIISLKGWREVTDKIYATSEHTIGLLLAVLRKIPAAHADAVGGKWERQKFIGAEISGKTVGLVGCGRLGSRVAEILHVMGATILGFDPYQSKETVPECIELVPDLSSMLEKSDIVSVHAYLTPETTGIIGKKEFAAMKPGAFMVNTSRGKIIDETALLDALTSGKLAGAALDVLDNEEASGEFLKSNPLREYAASHDNLILTPHMGGATRESMGLTEEAIAAAAVKSI